MVYLLYSSFHQPFPVDKYNCYLSMLPERMSQKIGRYRRWQDAHASLIGKILLIEGMKYFGGSPDLLHEIKYSEYDRPYLDHIEFNISHSGSYIICAIAENAKVGVDIEQLRPIEFDDFKSQFSEAEWAVIRSAGNSLAGFYHMWTKKEAIVKADGKGLSIPLKNIIIDNELARVGDDQWYLKNIHVDDHYVAHLASDQQISNDFSIRKVKL